MKRAQATKASRPQVLLHISRQRNLGEQMIPDHDRPRALDLVVTAVLVLAVLFANARGWM
jgi:hypothetical protein